LIDCDIRGDLWGGVVNREPEIVYIRAFIAMYAHISSCAWLGDICMLCDVVIRSSMLFGGCVM